jgi:hypothetical protein
MSPTFLEFLAHEDARERDKAVEQILEARKVQPARREAKPQSTRPGGLRRRLGRKLVSLGLYLDPQAEGPTAG